MRGNFTANGQNHGRPTYKKDAQVNGLDVQLYYWDDRDGASFCGWWFGPKVGGDQVWAYHPSSTAMTPPKTGWKVPYDGPVDNSFLISPTTASQTAHVPSSDLSSYSSPYQTAEQRIKQQQQELMQQQMIAQQQKAVQMSEMKKKQEEARRQQEEARVRQQEEVKRKAAEQRMKMEEMTRQKMEQEKRLAEERKRQHNEQRAAMTLRHFLAQKIRVAKEEQDLSTAQQELAELMAQQLPLCGANAEKVQAECAQAVEITMKRIEAEKEKKRQEEERKEEQMKKQKEAQEKAEELLRELGEKVATAEELVEQLTASAEQLCPEKDMKLEIVTKLANSMDSKAAEATGAINDCQSFVKEHGNAMMAMAFSVKPPEGVEADERPANLPTMRLRMAEVLKKKEMLIHGIKSSKEKLFRKAEAKKKMDVQMLKFKKHDLNKDDHLDKSEIRSYAKKEFGITLPDARMVKIMKGLGKDEKKGVEKADFHRLTIQIGIAREMQKDLARKKKREEHEKEIEHLKEELQQKVAEAETKYTSVDEKVVELEEAIKPLFDTKSMKSLEMEKLLETLEEQASSLKELISGYKLEVAEMKQGIDEEVTTWFTMHSRQLDSKTTLLEPRLQRMSNLLGKSRADLKKKVQQELAELEKQALALMRYHQNSKELSPEDFFAEISQNKEAVEKKAFLSFFKGCVKEEEATPPSAQDLTRLFEHLAERSAGISEERMMGLIRVYKKVLKETMLTEEKSIKSEILRSLQVGEIIELISPETPVEEEVVRARCRTMKDDKEGWVTVAGNGGTPFVKDYAGVYKVVKETIMTETFELDSAEAKEAAKQLKDATPRKLKLGELVDVWVWPKKEKSGLLRLKCKCRSDGHVGWATSVGNAGTVFLEVV